MVALDALSKYGVVPGLENDVQIHLTANGQSEEITFGRLDSVKIKRVSLKEVSGSLHLNLSGDGCAYMKVSNFHKYVVRVRGLIMVLNDSTI